MPLLRLLPTASLAALALALTACSAEPTVVATTYPAPRYAAATPADDGTGPIISFDQNPGTTIHLARSLPRGYASLLWTGTRQGSYSLTGTASAADELILLGVCLGTGDVYATVAIDRRADESGSTLSDIDHGESVAIPCTTLSSVSPVTFSIAPHRTGAVALDVSAASAQTWSVILARKPG
jgi:hypothetical protein